MLKLNFPSTIVNKSFRKPKKSDLLFLDFEVATVAVNRICQKVLLHCLVVLRKSKSTTAKTNSLNKTIDISFSLRSLVWWIYESCGSLYSFLQCC